jgi:transposase
MILNGLGFSDRPLTLTPQFFVNKPLDLLFREGVRAEMFNRFKLGRTLDEAHAYGCDLLLSELSLAVCSQERIDTRFNHLDTTSFSLTGDYVPDSDEHAIAITHGYSKDHRPDLKQAVLELMVSQDGGVPLMSKSWDGNASDTKIFQERAQALMTTFQGAPSPRYVVADAKLYSEENAANLKKLGFITRVPGTLKLVTHVIAQALRWDTWQRLDETTRYQAIGLCHYGMAQRWLVVWSQASYERAVARVDKACQREAAAIDKQLFHVQAQRFETPTQAQETLSVLAKKWCYHQGESEELIEHKRYGKKGRPTGGTPLKAIEWQMQARVKPDAERLEVLKQHKACFVLGTNIKAAQRSDAEVIAGYKGQAQAENYQPYNLLKIHLRVSVSARGASRSVACYVRPAAGRVHRHRPISTTAGGTRWSLGVPSDALGTARHTGSLRGSPRSAPVLVRSIHALPEQGPQPAQGERSAVLGAPATGPPSALKTSSSASLAAILPY